MVRFDLSYMNMQIQINQNNTNRSFGYKVDQDGFFDSNFNKATNIPDNIKIDANHINEFYQISANSNIRDYGHIDIVATLSNIYNDFSKIPSEQRAILAKEELEYREDVYGDFFSFRDEFLDENGNINESGEFFLLFNRIASLNENIIGTHSIRKQVEYDSELRNFIRKNSVYMIEGDNVLSGIMSHDINTSLELLSLTDKEKFKEKWLDALKEYKKKLATQDNTNNEDKPTKRKPIQGKSDNNETYVDENINKALQTLLESKFNKEKMLDILFGTNTNNINDDSMEIISEMNKNNVENKNNKKTNLDLKV